MLEYRSVEVLECWSIEVLESWMVEVLKCWSVRVIECWGVEVLECWGEYWNVGVLESSIAVMYVCTALRKLKHVSILQHSSGRNPTTN